MLALLSHFITSHVASGGYVAVFLLMLLGSACVPIPSEVVLLFGGALASSGFAASVLNDPGAHVGLVPVMAVGVAGAMVGSWLSYGVGYAGGRPLIDRFGRYLFLREHEVDRAHDWFERHGQAAVFWARLIPLARAFISLPAGVARMGFRRFSLYTLLGNLPWAVGLTLAGYGLGQHWTSVDKVLAPISVAAGLALLAVVAWWAVRRRREPAPRG